MSYVIRFGSSYRVFNEDDISVSNKLPPNTYSVKKNEMSGEYYLETIDPFIMPAKFYGDTEQKAKRILDTFLDRSGSMGVHMDGVKGSGKTLLAKRVSNVALDMDIPTIVVNNPHCGDDFNRFIQSIDVPAIILFDEFEKVYDYNTQDKILTLFDGVYPTKKLFIITTNKSHMVNEYLKNRPGRIYYSFKFDTLDQVFVEEYCNDNLKNKDNIESVLNYTKVFSFFNFDMLAAAVEEMNRYNETLQEVLEYLNIVPENKATDKYTITFKFGDYTKVLTKDYCNFDANRFSYYIGPKDQLSDMSQERTEIVNSRFLDEEGDVSFENRHLKGFDPTNHTFTFAQEVGDHKLELTVQRNKSTDDDIFRHLF